MTWWMPKAILKKTTWTLLFLPLHAVAQGRELNPQRFDMALKTAAQCVEEVSLISYCLRRSDGIEFVYAGLHYDLQEAVQKLEAAGASPEQNARFIHAILGKVRFSIAAAEDANLDKECTAKEVEKNRSLMMGVGAPLVLRPPFNEMRR